MNKHSEYPFTVEEQKTCGHAECELADHIEVFVNDAYGLPIHRWVGYGHNIEQVRANARLFKASPGLLAALKRLLSEVHYADVDPVTWKQVNAAIIEAEGVIL